MKTIVCWQSLLKYAKELTQAEKTGNAEKIAIAKQRHDDYVQLCREADEMWLGKNRHEVGF